MGNRKRSSEIALIHFTFFFHQATQSPMEPAMTRPGGKMARKNTGYDGFGGASTSGAKARMSSHSGVKATTQSCTKASCQALTAPTPKIGSVAAIA